MKKISIILSILASLALVSCDDSGSKSDYKECTPGGNDCSETQICVSVDADVSYCLESCTEATATDVCADDQVCIWAGNGLSACMPVCDPEDAESCGEGWQCLTQGEVSVCRAVCSADVPCPEDYVCIIENGAEGRCEAPCDPENFDSCSDDQACELRDDGLYGCYEPVFIEGIVSDSLSLEPIEGAYVMAADNTGVAVSTVGISDIDGFYQVNVPVMRDSATGEPAEGIFTLRSFAQDYESFPAGIRPSIPLDSSLATYQESQWTLRNSATDIVLIPLPPEMTGFGSVSGRVIATKTDSKPRGVLLALEAEGMMAPMGFSDTEGNYIIFNVPAGDYDLRGYKAFMQFTPVSITMDATDLLDVDITEIDGSYGTVTGSVNIVNPGDGDMTSVVLVPESIFNTLTEKGEVPAGLRAPKQPASPNVDGAFEITGVPDGRYVVLAAFENDFLVRDPDPNIAGTQIVHIEIPFESNYDVDLPTSFKVTGALRIIYPGAEGPEIIDAAPTFSWEDDSSEDSYRIVVYDAFGTLVWSDEAVPSVSSGNVEVPYAGPALVPGMYYQFRAWSMKNGGPISATEDLLGVFMIAPSVN